MKTYLSDNVYVAAKKRIGRLFDEFDVVAVSSSGGKDSTVVLNVTLEVAEEKGRLPVPLIFLDQESEWQATIDYMRIAMADPRVDPLWIQVPFQLSNATSESNDWLQCWEEGAEWSRPKEDIAIKENIFGTPRFKEMFDALAQTYWGDKSVAQLTGVRAEESPGRLKGLTRHATYKDITWGKKHPVNPRHFTFHPIYDWSFTDVWKAIHEHGWPYNEVYDWMYQYGIPVQKMRVSSVHHETSLESLGFMQEVEPESWDRITQRLDGINTYGHHALLYRPPRELPFMFESWPEYRDYLLDNLIQDPEKRAIFRRQFDAEEDKYLPEAMPRLYKTEIAAVLVNDWHGGKLETLHASLAHLRRSRHKEGYIEPWKR
jgi:predicted phosphoadenosine phosphosulfate sulfurtransferase